MTPLIWTIVTLLLVGVLVLAIGFSRLYLGAHYLSDVLAGFAAGIVWLAANIIALEATAPRPAGDHASAAS